ncbi:MAG TPA: crosslink repair DNA glycosylase YcaQ family protein, partial [Candidatus Limnocylindrales bacterium]|nr:crosslink repair DNA glycosylase YcaQ family protein [Candidatus Limnocylindrales bacterium]
TWTGAAGAQAATPSRYHRPMTAPRRVSAAAARRFMVLRHGLAPPRALPPTPDSVMAVVARLGSLQFDPLEVAGRNHDLVLLARIAGYRRSWTDALLYGDRVLYETYNKGLSLVPTAELPYFRIAWDRSSRRHDEGSFDEHAPLVAELLDRIRADGELSSTDVEPRAAIEWYWRPTNQVRALLEALAEAGVLGLSRRAGNRRYYDLVERLFPAELLADRRDEHDQLRHKLLSRFRAHGMLGRAGQAELWLGLGKAVVQPGDPAWRSRTALRAELIEQGAIVPVDVEAIRGERYVLEGELALLDAAEAELAAGLEPGDRPPGAAFLAPLDPFVWDRDFLRSLYDFDYVWEVYVPETKRRWGYYVLPILFGDRLVGRIEPRIDRKAGSLRILGLWWEAGFDPLAAPGFLEAFVAALEAHRSFGGVSRVALPRTHVHRPLVAAVRERLG